MEKEKKIFLEETLPEIEKEHNVKILLAYVRGSHMYGTNIETSDVDITFIYQQNTNEILKGNYVEQINHGGNDIVGYEIQRFLELLGLNNPNILESIDIPEKCIVFKDNLMEDVFTQNWLSKKTKKTILGYADSQIKKATGLNKNMNNPQPKERKSILDFCYVIIGEKSVLFFDWYNDYKKNHENDFDEYYLDHNNWGLSKVQNGKGLYALFLNYSKNDNMRGLVKDEESTQLRTSDIPLNVSSEQTPFVLWYNLDGFEVHCKQWAAYWKWEKEKNNERFNMNQKAGQGVDLKNMSHLFRLLDMCEGISLGKGLKVVSDNVEYLLDIRKGKYDYKHLLLESEKRMETIKENFEKVDLPDDVDVEIVKDLLLKFRQNGYFTSDRLGNKFMSSL